MNFDKLDGVEQRFLDVNSQLMDPNVTGSPARYRDLMRELKRLTPVVEKYRAYRKASQDADEARALMEESGLERDFRDMAELEYSENRERMERFGDELMVLLLPRDPNDDKNVIIEIRGGAGGEESALFAGSLMRMYTMYAEARRWKTETLYLNQTELGGVKEVSFSVEGDGAYSRLKYESGVHRVQRVPETESQGRVHTSTCTVAVLPEADEVELQIDPGDLQIDTYRASGAGGQHVNKTESAIRVIHLPTGLTVECQDERSQHKNKDKAMKILRSRLYEQMQGEQDAAIASQRKLQVGTGSRSERIRTYNFPQGRVSDHRIGLTLYKIDAVMNGEIGELIDALMTFDQAERLREQSGPAALPPSTKGS